MESILKKTRTIFLIKISTLTIDFISSVAIARYLNPNNYGIYAVIYLIPSLITSIGSFGFGPAIIYHLGKKKVNPTKLFTSLLLLGVILGSVYYFLLNYIFIDIINSLIIKDKFSLSLLKISTLYIPIVLVQKYIRKMLQGMNKITAFSLSSNLLLSILRLSLVGLAILVFDSGLNGIIWTILISNILVNFSIFLLFKYYGLLSFKEFGLLNKNDFSSLTKFAFKGHISSILQKSNDQLIKLIIFPLLNTSQFGFISLGIQISNLLLTIISSLQVVLTPKISQSSINEIKKLIPKVFRVLFVAIISISILFVIALPSIVNNFYGVDYQKVISISYCLIPGIFFLSFSKIFNLTLNQMGYPFLTSIVRSTGLITNLTLVYFLVKRYEENGFSISLSISYFVMFIVGYLLFYKKLNF